jgi:hypothetical protein
MWVYLLAFIQGFDRFDSPYTSFCHVALYVQIWHPVAVVQSEQAGCRKDVRGGFPP